MQAIQNFASWCVHRAWWWWTGEVSWLASTYLGAVELHKSEVEKWSEPVYQAFLSGAWLLIWTADTLYWVQKPTVHVELFNNERRLHNDSYAALESDLENLYFWHGVFVPAFVVVHPDWITVTHIETEENAEVRRVMVERMGYGKYILSSGAKMIHSDETGVLYKKEFPNDEPFVAVHVVNSTPEPDGTNKKYVLRVPPTMERARQAVAWTFGMEEQDYWPLIET